MIISTKTNRQLISARTIRTLSNGDRVERGFTISRSIVRTRTISIRTIDNEQVIASRRDALAAA